MGNESTNFNLVLRWRWICVQSAVNLYHIGEKYLFCANCNI